MLSRQLLATCPRAAPAGSATRLRLPLTTRCLSAAAATVMKRTALYDMHVAHGGKMVPFAGYDMPVQYADLGVGPSTEHTRRHASLFDVSHMLQFKISGADATAFMERLVVADLAELPVETSQLSVFTNAQGGIIDDCIVNRKADHFYVVSNAACADKDLAHVREQMRVFGKRGVKLEVVGDKALLALQGPLSAGIVATLSKTDLSSFAFMTTRNLNIGGIPCHVSRSGYTGEDGFEIQVDNAKAQQLAALLLKQSNVKWAGLGARDSLRLEAGMCLYGHDLDDTTTPVEAGLTWTIGKRRRAEGGFLGADKVKAQLAAPVNVMRRRVGLIVEGAPAREGAEVFNASGKSIGKLTSGGPSPCLKKNIAMAYVATGHHKAGTAVQVKVRGRMQPAVIAKMPFVPTQYHKV